MHRAKIAQPRVRMEGWRQRRPGSKASNPQEEKRKKEKNTLDSYRPSHGRHIRFSCTLLKFIARFLKASHQRVFTVPLLPAIERGRPPRAKLDHGRESPHTRRAAI